jgi:hypothetical protein
MDWPHRRHEDAAKLVGLIRQFDVRPVTIHVKRFRPLVADLEAPEHSTFSSRSF